LELFRTPDFERNEEISIIINSTLIDPPDAIDIPVGNPMPLTPARAVAFRRNAVSLLITADESGRPERDLSDSFPAFFFFCFSIYHHHSPRTRTFSGGRSTTIHSRLGDYHELTPFCVNSRICRGQFKKSHSPLLPSLLFPSLMVVSCSRVYLEP